MKIERPIEGEQPVSGGVHMPMPIVEIVAGLCILAALIWYVLDALKLPKSFNPTDVGAAGFPYLIAAGTGFAALLMLAISISGALRKVRVSSCELRRPLSVVITALLLVGQAALFETLGVYLSVGLFSAGIMLAAGERRPLHFIGVPTALTAGVYVVFALALNVLFP